MQHTPKIYDSPNYVVLDFEVDSGGDGYGSALANHSQLALACWSDCVAGKRMAHSRFGNELEQHELLVAVKAADFLVAHNAAYELAWLDRMGVDTEELVIFDTLLAEYVLAGNLASVDDKTGLAPLELNLDACCRRRGLKPKDAIVDIWIKNGIPVSQIPRKWLLDRCQQDVATTEQLFISQRAALLRSNRLPVLYTRCLLTPVLVDLEKQGIKLDKARVDMSYAQYAAKLSELETQYGQMTGGINWRSPAQVATYLYDVLKFPELRTRSGEPLRTTTGLRLTGAKDTAKLQAATPAQRDFLKLKNEIGKVGHALSKNLAYFKDACEHHGGIFRAKFNQSVTATHRLSSSGVPSDAGSVQFQNLPRAFKPLFRARNESYRLMEIDGSQLEFRVAAWLGADRQAIADILDPTWDAHVTTASYMTGIPYEKLLADYKAGDKKATLARQDAKPETFKPLYGGNRGTPAQERWYAGFRERYADLAKVQASWVAEVQLKKRLITPWGMRYYWPRAKVNNSGYCNVTASVYNYPVQALATAEIIPIALTYFWHATRELRKSGKLLIVNSVHDSVVVELDPEVIPAVRQLALDCFTLRVYDYLKDVYGIVFDTVPLGVSMKVGEFWGEGEEETYNVFNTGKTVRIK